MLKPSFYTHRLCNLTVLFAAAVLAATALMNPAIAAVDRCLAFADAGARLHRAALRPSEIAITFLDHASFLIESPKGIKAVTDYALEADELDASDAAGTPDIVTMNIAHESHWSFAPDKRIKHVLKGWNPKGGRARHDITLNDMRVRNVPTNLRGSDGQTAFSQNSIFIFEVGGLCIAHLGHLHHTLTPRHLAVIGNMDIVMVPVDGSFTLDLPGMLQTLRQLQPRLILPMHYFGSLTLQRFIDGAAKSFTIRRSDKASITVSASTLPRETEVLILPPASLADLPPFRK